MSAPASSLPHAGSLTERLERLRRRRELLREQERALDTQSDHLQHLQEIVLVVACVTSVLVAIAVICALVHRFRGGTSNAYLGGTRRRTTVHGAVIGWKLANVTLRPDNRLRFAGLSYTTPYDADADAVCGRPTAPHPAPRRRCTCGFHAYRERSAAEDHAPAYPLLRVALSGQFVEHDEGWRTAHQRVEAVVFRESCECGSRPGAFRLVKPTAPRRDTLLRPCCADCLRAGIRTGELRPDDLRSCDELRALLTQDVPVGRAAEISLADGVALSTAELDEIRSWTPPPPLWSIPRVRRAALRITRQRTTRSSS